MPAYVFSAPLDSVTFLEDDAHVDCRCVGVILRSPGIDVHLYAESMSVMKLKMLEMASKVEEIESARTGVGGPASGSGG